MTWTDDLVDSAMCLWEAMIDASVDAEHPITKSFEILGTTHMRYYALNWAKKCHDDWAAVQPHEFDEPFDWEWCPRWLDEHVDFSDPRHPVVR